MNRWGLTMIVWLCLFSMLALTVMFAAGPAGPSNEYPDTTGLWKKVTEAEQNRLPQTAIQHLKEIHRIALEKDRYGEALKATLRQFVIEDSIEGGETTGKIRKLEAELALASRPMKPLMRVALAHWYRQYMEMNRWRLLQRSRVDDGEAPDFTTWDFSRLSGHIASLFKETLQDKDYLRGFPISQFDDLLEGGNQPASLRPTLYDFIIFEALQFFTAPEEAATRPQDAFVLVASSPALAGVDEFIEYRFETADEDSHVYQALLLFQEILSFHRRERQTEALVDADLHRLEFVVNAAAGETKTERYIERLREIIQRYGSLGVAGKAYFLLARALQKEEKFSEAVDIAEKGSQLYKDTVHAHNCRTVVSHIKEKKFELKAGSVVRPENESELALDYKNIDRLYFRIVNNHLESYLKGEGGRNFRWLSETSLKAMIKEKPVAQWTESLPATSDFKSRQMKVKLPPLEPGLYRVLASVRDDFSLDGNKVQHTFLQVSDMGMVIRPREGQVEGFVVNNDSGLPLQGIQLQLWELNSQNNTFSQTLLRKSDSDGFFYLPSPASYRQRIIVAENPATGRQLVEIDISPSYRSHTHNQFERTFFFTDRSLYRPGQMVHFKGLCVDVDQVKDRYQLLPGKDVMVYFRDANNQEVGKLALRSNDFGSFSGTFVAPVGGLTGVFTLSTETPNGNTIIRVEEYKRPKFQVNVQLPEGQLRLDDEITVSGTAMAYTGAPVDGAVVVYRVFRETQLPPWWMYWGMRIPNAGSPQEVGYGTALTNVDGTFRITFQAMPDQKVPRSASPVFTYKVQVDVTDSSGETRSGETRINLGYAALKAHVHCAPWQEEGIPVECSVLFSTLNGKPVNVSGMLEIYTLKGPARPVPEDLFGTVLEPGGYTSRTSDWVLWPEDRLVEKKAVSVVADQGGRMVLEFALKHGAYRLKLRSEDKDGNSVEAIAAVMVNKPAARQFGLPVPFYFSSRSAVVEIGGVFEALWGTGYGDGPVLVEIFKHNELLKRYWSESSRTQGMILVPVSEEHKGGFTVVAHFVKANRRYRQETRVFVPYTDKRLSLKWKTFRSPLRPGQKETWALTIVGPTAEPVVAEMLAAMYDYSLDQFYPHRFNDISWIFKTDATSLHDTFSNRAANFNTAKDNLNIYLSIKPVLYPMFPEMVMTEFPGVMYKTGAMAEMEFADGAIPPPSPARAASIDLQSRAEPEPKKRNGGSGKEAAVELKDVPIRSNLAETAFFYPHLLSDKKGEVTIEFQMPEALTEWKFLGFAHSKSLQLGFLESRVQTRKELMVQPNPPRFLREGDVLEFSVKVTNMTDSEMNGNVKLQWFLPGTERILDKEFKNLQPVQSCSIPANQSRSYFWKVSVPDGEGIVGFRATAATDDFSDGEEGLLPVLSRRMLVHESIPLWITGPGQKEFRLEKLVTSGDSTSLKHHSLSLQMTANPAWYAIKALPYLMEFPHECSEQIFSRLYANSLARRIVTSNPEIQRVFAAWKQADPGALSSNLQKNESLTAILLQETPWVLDAKNETDAQYKVGLLFDANRVTNEQELARKKLAGMQLADGSWPWFPGGTGNIFITLHIVEGLGRLRHMGVDLDSQDMALNALKYLDNWLKEYHEDINRRKVEKENHLSQMVSLYLYARSFYSSEYPVPRGAQPAFAYFISQAAKYWMTLDNRMNQAHLALALHRLRDTVTPVKIVASLKERSLFSEEMGRYWKESGGFWWWYSAPIETQASMIEVFDEVAGDRKLVEECKIWLLKQKQTQNWATTKSTADAVYSLLLRGDDLLSIAPDVVVLLGGEQVRPEKTEIGTGYFEHFVPKEAIAPAAGNVTVKKTGTGIAWGGLHWQYWEDIDKISAHTQNPLRLKKEIFKQTQDKKGPVLTPVKGPLAVGDLLKVRIQLNVDRDMEFVHLKDHRGSGTEPVNVLSHYKYQDRLHYYESTRDAATHFFIDYLPAGTYVFEYPLRVVHRGVYPSGMAHIECMYAPEFNSHSASISLEVE